ncbi:YaaA family protein [Luethyella okanaganae]|uniref:YaaA family protein n=1 Tax=Luethyella okanaganae TaxID=69372 RepID=A0ABW1VJY6_9MICO
MLVILPPSEAKRDGGDGAPLDVSGLAFPALSPRRRTLVRAVRALARDTEAAMAALRLGPKQHGEVARNRALTTSPTMPALDRYAGVIFDALDAASLPEEARSFAHEHLVVHSALLGPVAALDDVPAYRMSHDSRLPELSLKRHWGDTISRQLARVPGLIVDMRSEGYAALGPAPVRPGSVYLRVLTEGLDGRQRALNHFNKKAKGELVRALLLHGRDLASVDDLVAWASAAGFRVQPHRKGAEGAAEIALIV